jgi:uncharacterized protein YcnI
VTKNAKRGTLVAATVAAVVFGTAAPALAHVQVSADKPQAGATDVTVQFNAESESDTAGAKTVQVQLPDGIAPAQVSYVSGPAGWTLNRTADGYVVSGNTLAVHKDVIYRVKIAKLPDTATSLAFKTIVTYGNNESDRWIEIPQAGQAEPPHPAPVLALQPAAAPPSGTPSGANPPTTTPTPTLGPPTITPSAAAQAGGASSATPWIIGGVILLVLLVGGGIWLARRRRAVT